ncbi:Hypothetical Protein FCC1311_014992 [Hondaea fermentalgiana]|uniref:Apple domain-containing protein n=1 Tax=Hondaea fermentalgiana TaxID=2315210 RepID=A0A2R5G2Q6_9STRA|nr:Hypothetical Protein FCC1311_014992 [Hondaea fermentalgiana]|eukprot:GBG25282.1 Hypothetical Protein FCC1311_014992 [Hondaea fermentalgiana]
MAAKLAVVLVVLLGLLGITSVESAQNPERVIKPGSRWRCGKKAFPDEDDLKSCKQKRKDHRVFNCATTEGKKNQKHSFFCLRKKKCEGDDRKELYCSYMFSNNGGESDLEELKCTRKLAKGNCLVQVSPPFSSLSSGERENYENEQEYNDESREDGSEIVCEDCIEEYCRLRCLASDVCQGYEFSTATAFYGTCTLLHSSIIGLTGQNEGTTTCYVRDADCGNTIPASCTEKVGAEEEEGACWGAGTGFDPCKDSFCSEGECERLCQLNAKCQGFEVSVEDDDATEFPTCRHYTLLPKALDVLVRAKCYRVAREHQIGRKLSDSETICASGSLDPHPMGVGDVPVGDVDLDLGDDEDEEEDEDEDEDDA